MRLLLILLLFPAMVHAQGIGRPVDAFISEMVQKHDFDRAELVSLFEKVDRLDAVIRLVSPTPAPRPNWQAYRARFVNRERINGGIDYWKKHSRALSRAASRFSVPPEIIVAIIGMETLYGRHTGRFRVLDSLSTLAFDYPEAPNRESRMSYFRGELENALIYARHSGIDPLSLYGSYAGAVGLPQFMPGSIMKYGVDFDGDGKVDLLHSSADAIGSVANFLARHGWRKGEKLVFPASIRQGSGDWKSLSGGLSAKFSLKRLEAAGIYPKGSVKGAGFGLIDLQNGDQPAEYWLGTHNFFAITQYNRSYYYAMSVVDLGRALKLAHAQIIQ